MKTMRMSRIVMLAALAGSPQAFAHDVPKITVFDAPGAVGFTSAVAINVAGQVAGSYADGNGVLHGYIRSPDGKHFVTVDGPNDSPIGTFILDLNDEGAVTGQYCEGSTVCHGFVREPSGKFIVFDASPDALNLGGTYGNAINDFGTVAGSYTGMDGVTHAFVRAPNGDITTFDAAGAGTQAGQGTGTPYPGALNNLGVITGGYADQNGNSFSYVRTPDGSLTEFSPPDGSQSFGQGINVFGVIVGNYSDDVTGVGYVYVRSPDGKHFTSFGVTGTGVKFTYPNYINAFGTITGFYNQNFLNHGFLRTWDGTITTFDAPGAGTTPHKGQGTFGFSINLEGAIVGNVVDSNNVQHGFVRAPSPP